MKRTVKAFAAMLLVALLVVSFAVPAFAAFDFDKYIEEFEPDYFNDKQLEIGKTHSPTASVWVQYGNGKTYCSDDTVVSVDSEGTVTAIGPGTAYVVYMGSTGMYQTYRFTVIDPILETTEATEVATQYADSFTAGWDNNDQMTADDQEPAMVTEQITVSDHTDIEHDPLKNVGAGGFAAMLVVIGSFLASLISAIAKMGQMVLGFGICFIALVISLLLILAMLVLSTNSMKEKKLPPRTQSANTERMPTAALSNCPKCGTAYGSGDFCPQCGTSRMVKKVYHFPIKGFVTARKFEKMANEWLAQNPYIYSCKLNVKNHASLLSPFVYFKFFVKSASIEYLVAQEPQPKQYGVAFIYRFRLFGPIGYSGEKHVEQWQKNNPDAQVISHTGGRIQHFGSKSGFYAQYYNYVFFKK